GAPTTDALEVFFTFGNLASNNVSGITLEDFDGYVANDKTSVFQTGADLATITCNSSQNAYQITIPSGQSASKPIVLKAKKQSTLGEDMLEQKSWIEVCKNPRNYTIVPSSVTSKKDTERKIYSWAALHIAKDITRFGTPKNTPIEHFEMAISTADVKQGSHGDCYFVAALLALSGRISGRKYIVEHTSQKQHSAGGKEFKVVFKNNNYTFLTNDSDFLGRGFQMAKISGDWHNDSDVKYNPNIHRNNNPDIDDGAEIWTQLYEYAWAKHKGGWINTNGGSVADVWKTITNNSASYETVTGKTNDQIAQSLKKYSDDNKWLCISTKNDFGGIKPNSKNLVTNHAYYVRRCETDNSGNVIKIVIVNPWDGEMPEDLKPEDFQFIGTIYILDPIPFQ
ncbi:MAG: hypothetical protein LBC74_05110, partial [Planctomycetaceae bacterium]|nr:hypothetical protein [Planctomycetaceae bacterium]